jgi:maltose 6'-phosphate phosphatase
MEATTKSQCWSKKGDKMRAVIFAEKISQKLCVLVAVMAALVHPLSKPAKASENGELIVLTINLLFSEIKQRDERLNTIADYVAKNEVDLVLLQEVVGGTLARTINSALDLRRKLAHNYNLSYDLAYRMANGLPGLLTVGNAILSRYDISFTLSKALPFESEEIFQGVEVPLKRKVIMSRINIPGFGPVNLYDTHLCAYCDPSERFQQAEVLLDFIRNVEKLIPGSNPIILGGDFNIADELINGDDLAREYDLIIDSGFVDSYGAVNGCTNCCGSVENSCTYGVDDNPYAFNLFTHQREETVRIDYIFLKGNYDILSSEVVFTGPNDWVSDHSALLTKVKFNK